MGSRSLGSLLAILFILYLVAVSVGRTRRPVRPADADPTRPPVAVRTIEVAAKPAARPVEARPIHRPEAVERALEPVEDAVEAGRFEEAVVKLQAILAGTPETPVRAESMVELARLHMVRKDFPAARELFDKFLKEFPAHPQIGNAQRAIEYMERYESFRTSFVPFESEVR